MSMVEFQMFLEIYPHIKRCVVFASFKPLDDLLSFFPWVAVSKRRKAIGLTNFAAAAHP
jgi:hypothetical protein